MMEQLLNNEGYMVFNPDSDDELVETYELALDSIFRWTLRRDELTDSEIVLAIKRVAKTALQSR